MTQVERLPLVSQDNPLEYRLIARCDVMMAAGFHLAAMAVVEDQLLLVFQEG